MTGAWGGPCRLSRLAALALASGAALATCRSGAADRIELTAFAPAAAPLDDTGVRDVSSALAAAIARANAQAAKGVIACVHIPAGRWRIVRAPPAFVGAGCVVGEGSGQSILLLDRAFTGDLFSWDEAWAPTTPGPRAVGLRIVGDRAAKGRQAVFVFYDRNDEVFLDDITVDEVPGRVLWSGVTRRTPQAYMRESHMRSLRFFNDGAAQAPVIEFDSAGGPDSDGTNEIRLSQVDVYAARGPAVVIRNHGRGAVRAITFEALRVEGREDGSGAGDLVQIGDPAAAGRVAHVVLRDLELITPPRGHAALRLVAPPGVDPPYGIEVDGMIDGGSQTGEGLAIDAGRTSAFHFAFIRSGGPDVAIGRGATQIRIDGEGREACWRWRIDPTSLTAVTVPAVRLARLLPSGAMAQDGSPPTGC